MQGVEQMIGHILLRAPRCAMAAIIMAVAWGRVDAWEVLILTCGYPVQLLMLRSVLSEQGGKFVGGILLGGLYTFDYHFEDVHLFDTFFIPSCEVVSAVSTLCSSPVHWTLHGVHVISAMWIPIQTVRA